ncbi:proSAAS [Xenopus laevis]|uniref:Uncharacterized protein n=2 Tax=Xenopus laevis TaxID=8355 RepID=A0A974C5H7_XENLA|nr:proSAAS [Xenopus laevis]OCT66848.1 hypothetical protein XELAEV_18038129mg [Xenopus laevis]
MMGPCVLLVAVTVCVGALGTFAKPLGSVPRDDVGMSHRFRRSLPAGIPYDTDMMSYLPSESLQEEASYPDINPALLSRLATYPQEQLLAAMEKFGLNHRAEALQDSIALQQLAEEGQRRDKEAMYLANLLHLWNQISQSRGYPEQLQALRRELPRSYQDYDDTGLASRSIRAQLPRNQLAQATQSHYRQDGGYKATGPHQQQEEVSEDGIPMDEGMLRFLVTRVLSAMSEAEMPQRLSTPPSRRLRRSLPENPPGTASSNLLRIKRIDDLLDPDYVANGLLRRKRIDGDLEARPGHYTDQLLKYLPD